MAPKLRNASFFSPADVAHFLQAHPTRRIWAELKLLQSNALSVGVFYFPWLPVSVRLVLPAGHKTRKCNSMIVWWEEQNSLLYLFANVEIVSSGGGNWFTVGRIQCGAGVGEVYSCFHAAANSRSHCSQAHAKSSAHYVSWYSWLDVVGRNFYHTQQLPLWACFLCFLFEHLVPRIGCMQQWHNWTRLA